MVEEILEQVKQGTLSIDDAKQQLATYENLGFAKIDHHRKNRQGFPEIVFGEGKTKEQIQTIINVIKGRGDNVLVTRISQDKADFILQSNPEFVYNETARILYWTEDTLVHNERNGYIAIVCAGTSDLRVAEEAAITAEVLGSTVRRFYDAGVAGIHRLLDNIDEIRKAN